MTNNNHQWAEERLSEYLDTQLALAELEPLETHLRECDRCRASLESLRQTVSLLKHASVPTPSRQFTLSVARSEPRPTRPSFGFLRGATALTIVLLGVVLGLDFFVSSQFRVPTTAPVPAAQFAAPAAAPTIIALAPTSVPAPTFAPTITAAVRPTIVPPQSAAQPLALPTTTRALGAGAAETQATVSTADQAQKSSVTTAAAPPAPRAAITSALISPSPLPTSAPLATAPGPTATIQLQARAEATRGRDGTAEPSQSIASPLRWLEIGLLALIIGLGALTIFAGRRK